MEALIEKIESGDLPLETIFSEFEIAVKQIQHCEQFLLTGVKRMELLIETLEDDLDF
ncbi:exodeoxyribonuclease VII small subunit [Crocosphaera watsonii]|uniref:exodeoxyribonuclease VII small subunit n=1 Tax=Crocosphaera watsonii TaxID=263511 RepID=UPI001E352A8F|nr:exodeoxyribonuclease VII small subunit [Crocosphaera watsonii]